MTPQESLWNMYLAYERTLSATVVKPANYVFAQSEIRFDEMEEIFLYSRANDALCCLAEIAGIELPEAANLLNPVRFGKELADILVRRLKQTKRVAALWDVAGIYFHVFLWFYRHGSQANPPLFPAFMRKALSGFGLLLPRQALRDHLGPTLSKEEVRARLTARPKGLRKDIQNMRVTKFGEMNDETKSKLLKKVSYLVVMDPS